MAKTASRPTMADVARLAGVSQSTVSLVLNASEGARIAARTRSKVIEAANELGYGRDSQTLHSIGTNQVIGMVIDELSPNWFGARLIDRLRDLCWEADADLLVASTRAQSEAEDIAVGRLLQHRPVGIFYASLFPRRVVVPKRLKGVQTVLLNCFEEEARYPTVMPDLVASAEAMLSHLLSLGHRQIGYLMHESWHDFTQHRLKGLGSALASYDLTLDKACVRYLNGAPDDGYAATHELLNAQPQITAIFCANDRMAYGAIDAAKERGLKVGSDVSICGYDDHEHARYTHPPLTTAKAPVSAIAREGLRHMLAAQPSRMQVTYLPGEIIERDSTGSIR